MDSDGFVSIESELRRRHASKSVFGDFQSGNEPINSISTAVNDTVPIPPTCNSQNPSNYCPYINDPQFELIDPSYSCSIRPQWFFFY